MPVGPPLKRKTRQSKIIWDLARWPWRQQHQLGRLSQEGFAPVQPDASESIEGSGCRMVELSNLSDSLALACEDLSSLALLP
jgi:hypothetical protein